MNFVKQNIARGNFVCSMKHGRNNTSFVSVISITEKIIT